MDLNPRRFADAVVLRPAGRIAVIEPWVSVLSFPVYRWLHQEGCTLGIDPWDPFGHPATDGKDPFQGNAAVLWRLVRATPTARWLELGFEPPRVTRLNGFAYLMSLGFRKASLLPGPLAGGLDHDSWIVVAAASSKLKVHRCIALLVKAGMHPRLCQRGDDQTVEVPAHERHDAFDLVERHRPTLHQPPKTPRTQPVPAWASFGAMGVLATWFTGLLTWAVVAFAWASIGPAAPAASPVEFLGGRSYLSVWFSLFLAATGVDTIPALLLEDGEAVVGEEAIEAYLDERFDEPAEAGAHRLKAAKARRRYLEEECECLQPATH